jgi:EmrB/QacA subfamily drug resistance transporter
MWLRDRQFVGQVAAIGGAGLMASMDSSVVVFALPKIQNDLGLSDAGRSWVITAYLLTFGGLILLGGRLGDVFGRKRIAIFGAALFTFASAACGVAWDDGVLVLARLLHGAAAAIVAPTCMALVATTFPKGPRRNAATAAFGALAGIGAILGLVVGGVLTDVSWRLAFLANVPLGLLVIYLARIMLQETERERMRLDALGAVLATVFCTAGVFGLSVAPEKGWSSVGAIVSIVVAAAALAAFIVVERTAENPIVPLSLFCDRNRLATYAVMFLARGVGFTLAVVMALYVQNILGYSPLHAGVAFIPFAVTTAIGTVVASRLATGFSPRVIVVAGAVLVLAAVLYGSTLNHSAPYFPNLVVPVAVGAFGLGVITVPLGLSLIASVGVDRIGPTSAIAVMLQSLGGPWVLVVIQAVITARTLRLGGTTGPVTNMTAAQVQALDHGYTYGFLWLAGVVVVLGVLAMLISYTADEVARAQQVKDADDASSVQLAL